MHTACSIRLYFRISRVVVLSVADLFAVAAAAAAVAAAHRLRLDLADTSLPPMKASHGIG